MAAVKEGKLVIMYLDGEPIIGPNADEITNDMYFVGVFGDFIVAISGINNTWDPLEYKGLDMLPFPTGNDDLFILTNFGGTKYDQRWATSSELRDWLQLYTKSGVKTIALNKWPAQSDDGIQYYVPAGDSNGDEVFQEVTVGTSLVIVPSMTSTSTSATLNLNYLGEYPLRLRGTGDTNTAVVPSKANWLVANKPIRVTYDGTYWVADLMDDIPTGMTYEEGELPTKPATPIADGEEIPYTWEEINAITLAGKAQEYFNLGSTKLVNLSTAVLGANAATMMVIGFDQDGENTVTFQTKGVLPTTIDFGSSAVWIGSTARTQCQNFYNACEAKGFIKTVSKGTCPSTNNSRSGTATYNDETVFLLSEREMGLDSYAPLSTASSTTSNAECTQGYNAAYSYYTSNTTRVKYQMSANGTVTTNTSYYWERSRHYNYSGSVCRIGGDGSANRDVYGGRACLAPAFVIGNSDAPSPSGKITQDGEDITDKVKGLVGGAQIATGSYTGTNTYGSSNPNSLTFEFEPKLVLIYVDSASGANGYFSHGVAIKGSTVMWAYGSVAYRCYTTWSGKTLSWYCDHPNYSSIGQLNYGILYRYIAFG